MKWTPSAVPIHTCNTRPALRASVGVRPCGTLSGRSSSTRTPSRSASGSGWVFVAAQAEACGRTFKMTSWACHEYGSTADIFFRFDLVRPDALPERYPGGGRQRYLERVPLFRPGACRAERGSIMATSADDSRVECVGLAESGRSVLQNVV